MHFCSRLFSDFRTKRTYMQSSVCMSCEQTGVGAPHTSVTYRTHYAISIRCYRPRRRCLVPGEHMTIQECTRAGLAIWDPPSTALTRSLANRQSGRLSRQAVAGEAVLAYSL